MKIINQNQRTILELLKKSLFKRIITIPEDVDWNALFKEAIDQAVLPLVYSSASDVMPSIEKAKWQMAIYQLLANNVQVLYDHREVHRLLSDEKIPYTIIKGACSAKYYPQPNLRIMGDVDFVVKKEDLIRVGRILEKTGFVYLEDKEHLSHQVYHKGNSIWEMHWSMAGIPTGENGKMTRDFFDSIIETAIFDSQGYMIPDEFHHGLVMLIHTAEHLVNTGIGLRHICDWAVFVERYSDEEFKHLFEERLKECGLWRFAQLLTQLSMKFLGLSVKSWALENVDDNYLNAMIADVFEGGNFGIKDLERINQAKLFTNQGKGTVGDVAFMVQLFQTMNERTLRAVPFLRKKPWLMPAGWLYVGLRHLCRIKKGTRPPIHVEKMIKGASERRDIYREFHLFAQVQKYDAHYDWLKRLGMPVYFKLKGSVLRKPLYYIQDAYFVIRYWLYGPRRITKADVENVEKNVTFLYKSFERQRQAKRLYKCIRRYYPKAKVVIADDSKKPLTIKQADNSLTIINLPFNSGLSKGLEAGMKYVSTEYVMRMDDDELLTPKSMIYSELRYLQRNREVDLVGLQVTHLDRKRLTENYKSIKMNKPLKIPAGTMIDGKTVVYKSANVYLVRTEKLKEIGFDSNIRMLDHHEFFYRAAGTLVSVIDEKAIIMHCHNMFEPKEYDSYRNDVKDDARYIAIKYGGKYR